ncbi:MAG TPA: maltotransferase domain-containing protein [Geminicoccaceae bacterium]
MTTSGPRIYNLFPLLAGPMPAWAEHLPRIGGMGFDWVFVNPFHYPGFSGSLYAIKDLDRLHPIVAVEGKKPDELVKGFTKAARGQGLSVMIDLVINHTSKDARLVDEHPEWFRREDNGELRSPRAVDPLDPRKFTVWGDLAEITYDDPGIQAAQIQFWSDYVRGCIKQGVRGFRCDAAYQVPAEVWQGIIGAARKADPGARFFAETLGCTPAQVTALAGAGFDFMFNSSKWWDFRSPWLLEQYEMYRHVAPTVAFPESHDTERLAMELGDPEPAELERRYRFHYLFSAAFSSGVMMPMGFEFGCRTRMDVVGSRPGDWEWETAQPRIDLTRFIGEVNRMKAAAPALNVEGPQRVITAPHSPVVGLLRLSKGDVSSSGDAAIVLINPDPARVQGIDPGPLLNEVSGRISHFEDVTPNGPACPFEPGHPISMEPLSVRVFRGAAEAARQITRTSKAAQAAAEKRLMGLAQNRVVIEKVTPELDGGRHAIKRGVGDVVAVEADVFCDGHDKIDACIRYRAIDEAHWREAPLVFWDNDRWRGRFPVTRNTRYFYTIEAWRDLFDSWRAEIMKKHDAGLDVGLELTEGRQLILKTAAAAKGDDRKALSALVSELEQSGDDHGRLLQRMLAADVHALMKRAGIRTNASTYKNQLEVFVDRPGAKFAAWYEMFPRSASDDTSRHGTFRDVIRKLPYVRDMGFDVLYFTPIHPIGAKNRKGRNNTLTPGPDDPGSPYAIGSKDGGHDALHPELGTFDDFAALVEAAHDHGLEIAIDFAIQCAPDHPWITEHPEWFDWRPDGSIKYAENPPKKYEDIVNVHFYRDALPAIWYELRDIVLFWVDKGVKIFRVDNPHTKPVPFWEWMIREVLDRHPDVVFLAEAFTRPKMMRQLAKVGFTQSYSYFTWRNTKAELIEYLTELTQDEPKEYMRVNFFPNTPDINPVYLQTSGPPGFKIRLVLASTLSTVYGIYNGYELAEGRPIPGKEEYLDSEKYEIKAWDYDRPGNIRDYITRVNRIRRENPALHDFTNLRFQNAWNDNILVYGKMTGARDNIILIAVSLDPHAAQACHFEVPLWELGLPDHESVQVEDLFTGGRFTWHGKVQHVWLDPQVNPCAIWRITPPGLPG